MRWPLRDSGDSPSPDSGDSGDSGDSAPSDTAPSDSGVEMLPWDMDSSFQQATGWK
jgi:hypothetical protein